MWRWRVFSDALVMHLSKTPGGIWWNTSLLVWTPWVIFASSFCLPGGSRALSPTMIAATILRMTMTPRAGGPSVRRQFPKCWDLQRQPASRSEENCRNLCLMTWWITWWILISWLTIVDDEPRVVADYGWADLWWQTCLFFFFAWRNNCSILFHLDPFRLTKSHGYG